MGSRKRVAAPVELGGSWGLTGYETGWIGMGWKGGEASLTP
ncbi:hypothetical protein A2U01_0035322, partial [Trifolium medium]|nr:hypothetical protein [Trifolium medium]